MFIEIAIPVSKITFSDIIKGQFNAIGIDSVSGELIKFINKSNISGNFDGYTNVIEFGLGFETFKPSKKAGWHTLNAKIFFTKSIDSDEFLKYLSVILKLHPWEHPVITISNSKGAVASNQPLELFVQDVFDLLAREK